MNIHTQELAFIKMLQSCRSDLLDSFFIGMNFFDTAGFYLLLFPLLWYGVSEKLGIRVFILLAFSGYVNSVVKDLLALPRPFHLDESLAVIKVGNYGFPSGAAQNAVIIMGLIILEMKTRWRYLLGFLFFFLLSFSRVYLGVHFFTDILGGWCIGGLLLFIYVRYKDAIYKSVVQLKKEKRYMLALLLPIFFYFLYPMTRTFTQMMLLEGAFLGLVIEDVLKIRGTIFVWSCSIKLVLLALTGAVLLYLAGLGSISFLLLGLWLALGVKVAAAYCLK